MGGVRGELRGFNATAAGEEMPVSVDGGSKVDMDQCCLRGEGRSACCILVDREAQAYVRDSEICDVARVGGKSSVSRYNSGAGWMLRERVHELAHPGYFGCQVGVA